MANYTALETTLARPSYGLLRIDHVVGNVPRLVEVLEYVMGFTGACSGGVHGMVDACLGLGRG